MRAVLLLQQGQNAFALVTVPFGTSLSDFGSNISKSIFGVLPLGLLTFYLNALLRPASLESQKPLTRGISAPQFGDSHRTVLAHS